MDIDHFISKYFRAKLTPQAVLTLSFITVIMIGTFLLSREFASTEGQLNFVDSLFTAASATCVTGLVVVDTGTYFSTAGQLIILFLIQVGGLGIMTFSILFLFYIRGRFGIGSREIIQETLAFFETVDIASLLKAVFIFTFSFEAVGAILLAVRFSFDMPLESALYSAVFHSISAFCNAGFSIYADSMTAYRGDIFVNIIMMALIISGGLGFIVVYELFKMKQLKKNLRSISLHSKVVLLTSVILIAAGTLFIFAFEYNVSMDGYDLKTKLLTSVFQSVTSRTAGFNTIDIGSVSMVSLFVIITLMFVGASPASCGGGVKTATMAVIYAYVCSRIRDTKNVNLFYNSLPFKVISKAIVIVVFGILIVVLFAFLISLVELGDVPFHQNGSRFIKIYFEVVSAFGTVGLSTGITSELSNLSRVLITILMLIGRVGPLTVAVFISTKAETDIKYAEDKILVG